jgi:hypothetical protein
MMLKKGFSIKRLMLSLFVIGMVVLISGCKPETEVVTVDSVTISTVGNVAIINTIGGTLQFSAVVLPADAENKAVVWSVQNGTG